MKKWTSKNLHEFNIEAVNMGQDQKEIAEWVENHIYKNSTPETIQEMLNNADRYVMPACEALGWHSVPQNGGLTVNVWGND